MKNFATVCLMFFSLLSFAGKGGDDFSKMEKVFFKNATIDLGDATLTLEGAVATDAYIKFKMVVKNNTSDYLLVKPSEIVLVVNGKEYKANEKKMIIAPNDDASKVIDIKGSEFRVQQFSIKFNGFNKIATGSSAIPAPNFKLPVAVNAFDAGSFKVNQLENEKKTDFVAVKFSVSYDGAKIGLITPSSTALKFPNGSEFANMKARMKPLILEKGETDNFRMVWREIPVSNGDAQFANLEILWRDAFKEGALQPIPPKEYTLEWDPGMTKGKR